MIRSCFSRFLLSGALLAFAVPALAQGGGQVQYKITRDDPATMNNFWVSIDAFYMDLGFKNIMGLGIGNGIHSTGIIKSKFGYDAMIRYGTLTLGKLANSNFKSAYHVELGGFFNLRDYNKARNLRVVLKVEKGTDALGRETETTTFIRVPGTERRLMQPRAGLYLHRSPFELDYEDLYATDIEANVTMAGIYVGLGSMRVHNLFINTDKFGKCYNSGILRLYADALILPVVNVGLNGTDYNSQVKPGRIGFRVGMASLPTDIKKNVKRGLLNFSAEVGMRPLDGLFVGGSMYLTIVRKQLKAFGAKESSTAPGGQPVEKE